MIEPDRSFVFYPAHNQLPDENNPKGNDATGAFHPGAETYRRYYTGLGKAVVMCKFDNQAPAEKRRAQILNAMAVGAGEAWYDAIVYFGHGYKDGMPSAGFGPGSIDSLNEAIWNYGQYSVKVVLYACSCAAEKPAEKPSRPTGSWPGFRNTTSAATKPSKRTRSPPLTPSIQAKCTSRMARSSGPIRNPSRRTRCA